MADILPNPYEGANTDEERDAIYQNLLIKHEQEEYERKKSIYSDLIADWERERAY